MQGTAMQLLPKVVTSCEADSDMLSDIGMHGYSAIFLVCSAAGKEQHMHAVGKGCAPCTWH